MWFWIIFFTLVWYFTGFFISIYLLRKDQDIDLSTFMYVLALSIAGFFMIFIALKEYVENNANKIIFKKVKEKNK